jgi:hypothetical protein
MAKNHSGSGQLKIRNKFEVKISGKTDKIGQNFSTNMPDFKILSPFLSKYFS